MVGPNEGSGGGPGPLVSNTTETSDGLTSQANRAFELAETQLRRLVTNHPGYFPIFTKAGKWKHEAESWTNWCEGFLGGMLWIVCRPNGRWKAAGQS